ncbi:MAG TPA: hypothetical protein VI112_09060 [Bacteroidia bacterium]|jgi:hypothetical protein
MRSGFLFFLLMAGFCSQRLAAQYCPPVSAKDVSVHYWDASKGPIAEYAAHIFSKKTMYGTFIILGQANGGVYSIQCRLENDATGAYVANLVFTPYSGEERSYVICNRDSLGPYLETDSLGRGMYGFMKRGILKYEHEKVLVPPVLRPVWYGISRSDDDGVPGLVWVINKKKNRILYWDLSVSSEMCWCFYSWSLLSEKFK